MTAIDPNTPPAPPLQNLPDSNARPNYDDKPVEPLQAPIASPQQAWDAATAKRIVLADFNRAQAFRASEIEPKWQEAHSTYVASVGGQKHWEGSRVARANLQVHQAFQQVNALKPQIVDAICGGDLDFDVEAAKFGTTIGQCMLVRSLMQYLNRSLGGMVAFQTFRSCIERLVHDMLIMANGIQEFAWDGPREVSVPKWQTITHPEFQHQMHPLGFNVIRPTGRTLSWHQQQMTTEKISRFILDPVELTDFYIDPNCRSVNVQEAAFVLRRRMMTIADIASYRGQPGWDVPDDKALLAIAERKYSTEGDTTNQQMQSQTGVNAPSQQDYSADPRMKRLEVLRYWQKGRHVWLIGRDHVMWNAENQYGVLPFFNCCYVNKPGSFYGFSIPELLRTGQDYIKQLLDGRADELNLILHPPFISKAGTFRSASKSRLVPGANWEVTGDPLKDVVRLEMGNVTQSAFVEVNAAESRGQQVTGVSDLTLLGTPSSGGNSANRTATGVTAQTSASTSRVHGTVAMIEDTFLGPLLEQEWTMLQMYLQPEDIERILGAPALQELGMTGADVLNSDPSFKMKTASRMKMRAGLQGGGLNTVLQYVLNPEVQGLLGDQQNKTVDIEAISELVMDTFNIPPFALFRPMTPEEQQAKQQRNQQSAQEKLALQSSRLQAMSADAHQRDDAKHIDTIITALATAGLLPKVMGLPATIELESKQLDAEIEGGQYEAPQPNAA